ncbi:MAG: DUF3108 domain-containing protein [Nevskia sp.]|jgi:hypothetical protein|nr:DUF3108 domain-containing protein [Nevskia sp.]
MKRRGRWLLPLLTLTAALGAVRADEGDAATLAPFDHWYDTSWGGIGVGQMEVRLQADGTQAGCYRYSALSHPTGLVAALYGSPNQESRFCLVDGRIRSRHFDSVLPGDDQQSYVLSFDWDQHTVTDENGKTREIPDDAIDSLALQLAVRLWVEAHAADAQPPLASFTMVDQKNLTHYQFRLAGRERVDTPAGSFDTLRLERIDHPDKRGRFWLAPALDYLPVRIETKNGGRPTVTLILARR